MEGQMNLEEWSNSQKKIAIGGCIDCACGACLYWWSSRCPYGGCWDDHRAQANPYNKAHPWEPPRKYWSNWNKPGEQEHWCRGGTCYPISYCPEFVKYKGQQIQTCLKASVSVFQDGYINCSLVESMGCEACYKEFEERIEKS